MNTIFDLYTDYWLSSFGQTTATSLAQLLDGALSHDEVTRFLNQSHALGPTFWKHVKPLVRQVQSPAGVLIVDDSFLHKPHSQPNALVKVYFDHSQQAYVKAISFLTLLYRVEQALLPVGLHVVTHALQESAPGEAPVWRAAKTKNEAFRDLLQQAHQNAVPFTYVLADSWYTNAANINAVRGLDKHWLGAVKANVTVALTAADRAAGRFVPLSQLPLAVGAPQCVYLRSVAAPVLVCKDILPNKDGLVGEQLLLTMDTGSTYQQILNLSTTVGNRRLPQVLETACFFAEITCPPGAGADHASAGLRLCLRQTRSPQALHSNESVCPQSTPLPAGPPSGLR